jgi:hypothetical protein
MLGNENTLEEDLVTSWISVLHSHL